MKCLDGKIRDIIPCDPKILTYHLTERFYQYGLIKIIDLKTK